jgi:hypothetical protein
MELKSEMDAVRHQNKTLNKTLVEIQTLCKSSKVAKQVKVGRFEAEHSLPDAERRNAGNDRVKGDMLKRKPPTFILRKTVPKPKALSQRGPQVNYTLRSRHYLATIRKSVDKRKLMNGILTGAGGQVGVDRLTVLKDVRVCPEDGRLETCVYAVIEMHALASWQAVHELVNCAAVEDVDSKLCTCELIIDFNGKILSLGTLSATGGAANAQIDAERSLIFSVHHVVWSYFRYRELFPVPGTSCPGRS